jgi:hypothetical protein
MSLAAHFQARKSSRLLLERVCRDSDVVGTVSVPPMHARRSSGCEGCCASPLMLQQPEEN